MEKEQIERKIKVAIEKRDFKIISTIISNSANNKEILLILKKYLRKLIKEGRATNMSKLLLGRIEKHLGNYDKAISYFNSVESITSIHRENIYMEIIATEFRRNNFEKVKEYCYLITSSKYLGYSQFTLGIVEMIKKNFSQAKKHFENGIDLYGHIECYKNLAWVNIRENNYYEALKNLCLFIKKNGNKDAEVGSALLFLCKELNIFINDLDIDYHMEKYTSRQIANYKVSETIGHVLKHTILEENEHDSFESTVDLGKLINIVMNKMNSNSKISSSFCDVYIIPYHNIGVKGSNYIKVVTLPNTQKIITMFPIKHITDCDEYKLEEEKVLKMI